MQFEVTSNVLRLIADFAESEAGLDAAGVEMKKKIAQRIIELLPSNMHWKGGNGALAGSFHFDGTQVYSDMPYAHRREFSFHGPDARGRMFPNDPAAFYMRDTLQQVTSGATIDEAFQEVMGSLLPGGE